MKKQLTKKIKVKNLTPEVQKVNIHAQALGRLSVQKRKNPKEHMANMRRKRWEKKPVDGIIKPNVHDGIPTK